MKTTIPLILVITASASLNAQQIAPGAYLGQGATAVDRAIDSQRYMQEQQAAAEAASRERERQRQIDDQQRQIDNIRRQQQ